MSQMKTYDSSAAILETDSDISSSVKHESKTDDYLIENFTLTDSEASRLSRLIEQAFLNMDSATQSGGTIQFNEDTFKFMFCTPHNNRNLFIRAIHKPTGDIVGFMGTVPRNVKIGDKVYRGFVPSWEAVHWQHQRKGIAKNMVIKLIEYGITQGIEVAYALFEPEEHGINSATSATQEISLPMEKILTINKFIIRVLDIKRTSSVIKLKFYEKLFLGFLQGVKKPNNPRIRSFKDEDAEFLYELIKDFHDKHKISIIHEKKDFIWYLKQPVINCVVHVGDDGKPDGFMVAWKFNLSGFGNSAPYGWIDVVHTHRLSKKDAKDLAAYMSFRSKELGWAGLQSPFIPYYDPEPLKKAKFVFFPKRLVLTFFRAVEVKYPEDIKSLYLDWR